jgi:hypothetical protein
MIKVFRVCVGVDAFTKRSTSTIIMEGVLDMSTYIQTHRITHLAV